VAKYTFYPAADKAQDQIWQYTSEKWGEAQAEKYIRGLHEHLQHLANMELHWRSLPQTIAAPADIKTPVYFGRYERHYLFFRDMSIGIGVLSILHELADIPVRLKRDLEGFAEQDELNRIADMMNQRGHAPLVAKKTPNDLRAIELQMANRWVKAVGENFNLDICNIKSNPNDPPECLGTRNGEEIGIELTELVDGAMLDRIREEYENTGFVQNSNYNETQWSFDRFQKKLNEILKKKDKKYSRNKVSIDVLIIYSDEPWLLPPMAAEWLNSTNLYRCESINSAYLLLEHNPDYDQYYPVFHLF
jgi:plasmid stabilization system protein ParE